MIKPILSIIIPSFNTASLTKSCLLSIAQDKGLELDPHKTSGSRIPTEVIVVDNASTDNSIKVLQKLRHPPKIIANKTNLGFSQANNQGLKAAQGNYILYLNSDTQIIHSSISQTLNWFSSHPESGLCTAQLLNPDMTIQPSGGFFPNLANLFTWSLYLDDLPFINLLIPPVHPHPPQFYFHDRFFLSAHRQDWLTGAFILGRRELLEATGGFDNTYHMYGEDIDLCFRFHRRFPDYSINYLVDPQIIHYGGSSAIKKSDPLKSEYLGIIKFFQRHRSSWQLPIARSLVKINCASRLAYYSLTRQPQITGLYQQVWSKI